MQADASSYLPIGEDQLSRFTERANHLLASVKWTPKQDVGAAARRDSGGFRESSLQHLAAEELSLVKLAREVSGDPLLLTETVNHVLLVLRQGLRVGMHVAEQYHRSSGLETLSALNSRGGLAESQKTEFKQKFETASAVAIFSCASYVVWELGQHRADEARGVNMEFAGVPELSLLNPSRAYDCALFYYAAYISRGGVVHGELDLLKLTLLYFRWIVDEVVKRRGSLRYLEAFEGQKYKLVSSEFRLEGLATELETGGVSVEFNRVELDAIVGNRDAKHKARRLAERLLCYDPETHRNPMYDLGGLPPVRMGHGRPGTGKSLQIAATATMLQDHCEQLGIPFLFWPMPDNLVSTFQGGSAERTLEWMRPLRDPTKIIYAPCDDAENNFENRTRQGVSAGVREVIGVFLRNTEGAYAVNHGNAVIELFTNLPEQIDPAVLSRIRDRFLVDGAETREDFLDQDHLWWRKFEEISPEFVTMTDPADYRYMEAQRLLAHMGEVFEGYERPHEERIREVFDRVHKDHRPDEHEFFAVLFREVQEVFPYFRSRDVRNIQAAINERVMDFDLDPQWLADPGLFFRKDYDAKRAMIVDLMRDNMEGLSFAQVRLQETLRYLDGMCRISAADEERRLDAMVEDLRLRQQAVARLERGNEPPRAREE